MNPAYSTTAPLGGIPLSSASRPSAPHASTANRTTGRNPYCGCESWVCPHEVAKAAGYAFPPQQYSEDPLAWAKPAFTAYDNLHHNAGVRPRHGSNLGCHPRLPEEWTWEMHYTPLERLLLQLAEDTNARQQRLDKYLVYVLGGITGDISDMKAQLKSLRGEHGGLANALTEDSDERKVQFQSLQQQQTKTIDALVDIVQVLSGVKNAPVSAVVENEDDFADLPHLLDPTTGKLVYTDKVDKPTEAQQQQQPQKKEEYLPLPLCAVEQPHLPASSPEEAAARQQWNDLLQKDGAKAWALMEKVALGPNPPAAGRESRDAVLALARAEEVKEVEEEKEAEEREKEEEEEPFEPVDLEDLASSSSSGASTCTLDANDAVEPSSSATVEQDMEQYINAPDSSFATALASSSSTVNFVSPSSPVTADAPAEKIEQVLAEMHTHVGGGGKKRARSVFEVFEHEEGAEQGTKAEDPVVEQVMGSEAEEEEQEEEDDETRLLRLQLRLLETKLQLAKAMKQRAEGRA